MSSKVDEEMADFCNSNHPIIKASKIG